MSAISTTPDGISLAIGLALASLGHTQTPVHDRGPGELLPPQLRQGPPAGDIEADLTVPAFLWAFHRDSLLPESARKAVPPAQLAAVVDALLAAGRNADEGLRWQSLWSIARIARLDAGVAGRVRTRILEDGLLGGPGALAEVAAVAAGFAARDDLGFLGVLAKVANDPKTPPRQQAFAFYGLGLAATESTSAKTQFQVLTAVQRGLLPASGTPMEVRVASLHALALTRIDVAKDLPGPALALLEAAWNDDSPRTPIDFVANVPIAVAAMLKPDDAAAEPWRQRFAAAAQKRDRGRALPSSCVLALGALCRPWNEDPCRDAEHINLLCELAKDARDLQQGYYAWFALGLVGGNKARAHLIAGLQIQFIRRPWPALGLAAIAAKANERDAEIEQALQAGQGKIRDPNFLEAFANARKVAGRERDDDTVNAFRERYHVLPPGEGDVEARIAHCLATLADDKAPIEQRRLAAMALGHFADTSPRHWSSRLARAVDYRAGTPVLLGLPNGVLRLP